LIGLFGLYDISITFMCSCSNRLWFQLSHLHTAR